MDRKTINKKTRFDVFKRDAFTCQYCGRMAPDVVLEIDHINPVCNGGTNDIMNLITSCFECNRGKGKRLLKQNDELKKQQEQLKQLNKKRMQLEMLIEWKKELENFEEKQIDEIEKLLLITGFGFNEYERKQCKKNIEKYGFDEVYESTRISINQYYNSNDEESIEKTFNYIWRICANRKFQKNNPEAAKINYLVKMVKNNYNYFNKSKEYDLKKFLIDNFQEEDFETLKNIIKYSENYSELSDELIYYYFGGE